jgi:hypothetical protein
VVGSALESFFLGRAQLLTVENMELKLRLPYKTGIFLTEYLLLKYSATRS